jgi:23S rRNA (uracil-5-)-methyltransferase RumA
MTDLCPNKEFCGSCGWSHIPYEKQLSQKLSDINGSFKLKGLDVVCQEILPAEKTSHYRNRMDFVIDFEGRVGMRQKGKWWRVVDNNHCFISDEKIEELFDITRAWTKEAGLTFYDRKAHHGLLRYAVIRITSTGESMLNIVTSTPIDSKEEEKIQTELSKLSELSKATTLVWSINSTITDVSFGDDIRVISGAGYIEEEINGSKYRISPNAFFQTNSNTATLLQKTVEDFCEDLSEKTLLDLYCGTGFFAISLAGKAKQTIGVELNEDAIKDANVNAELNNVNVEFHDAKTEEFDWGKYNADVVILDPPRSGMHDKALADVLRILPETIIYVSCSPKNFAREMLQLQEFYEIKKMTAIDMFPHTPHVELVTKLVKK